MAVKKIFEVTQEKLNELKIEIEYLKNVKRQENVEALKEARAQGDLSENADYDAARNEQARIEARIAEIENILKNHRIIKISSENIVGIGKSVKVLFIERNDERIFHLVGSIEADPRVGKISIDSPIGKAIIGKEKDEIANVKSETGRTFDVKIVEIS